MTDFRGAGILRSTRFVRIDYTSGPALGARVVECGAGIRAARTARGR
jgi:hypothetical protein